MAEKNSKSNPGASNPVAKFLPIVVILIGVAAAAYFFIPRSSNNPAPTATPATGTTTAAPQATAAAPAAPAPELTKEQLIKEASAATKEARYVSPAGNNAVEYYLRVLEKEPNNPTAKDALRETFPFATPVVEQSINTGNVDEAAREIELLAKADPNNYTLTILRSKLGDKKKQTDREQAQQTAAAAAAAAKTAAGAAQTTPAATPAPETAAATPTPAPATATPPASRPQPVAAAPTPAPAVVEPPPPPVTGGESHPAQVVKTAQPDYPPDAYRKRLEGWVEVEFTVTADGQVANATVANANPARVFNDAALRAVQRWTFKPKMDNGKAVDDRIKRRIEFKIGA